MNSKPNKKQKDWHNWLRENGCSISGHFNDGRFSVHHIAGSRAKLKGVKGFGEWYCICLVYWWHQDGNNPNARHTNKTNFLSLNGSEKDLWIIKAEEYKKEKGEYPLSEEEYLIILERA